MVCGGNQTDIHADRAVAPEALELLFLDCPQQFGLKLEWNLADFIQKERAAVGQLETPDLL